MRCLSTHRVSLYLVIFCLIPSVRAKSSSTPSISRIVGGATVNGNTYPFFTLVERAGNSDCAGSLIWPDIVLSAAHCWDESSKAFIAHVNFTSYSSLSSDKKLVSFVEHVAIHPDFDQTSGHSDMMLLKLANPIFDIKPVVFNEVATIPKAYDLVTVVGVGQLEFGVADQPDKLQEVTIPVVSMNVCNSASGYQGVLDDATQLCAGAKGKDACQGDSGGPLLLDGKQVGIVNFGQGCGKATHPGVYTRISAFAGWIDFVKCNLTDVPCPGAPTKSPTESPASTASTFGSFLANLLAIAVSILGVSI